MKHGPSLESVCDVLGISLELILKFNEYMYEDDKVMKRHYAGKCDISMCTRTPGLIDSC